MSHRLSCLAVLVCAALSTGAAFAQEDACLPVVLYEEDFETGAGILDWTTGVLRGAGSNSWLGVQNACPAHSGNGVFRFGGAACDEGYAADQLSYAHPPAIQIPAGAVDTRLSFWHARDFEEGADGGKLTVALDSGSIFHFANNTEIVSGAQENGTIPDNCAPGNLFPYSVFTGQSDGFEETVFDLDGVCDRATSGSGGCSGHALRLGFTGVANCANSRPGWFLDDIRLTACMPPHLVPMDLYTLAPCRLIDTRQPDGDHGSPALQPGVARSFLLTGRCGIPETAHALALNITVIQPAAGGYLQAFPGDLAEAETSVLNFQAGDVRAGNAIVSLARDGAGTLKLRAGAGSQVEVVVDVMGYFSQ